MTETSPIVLLAGAWLFTYLLHSTILLGATALLSRALEPRFERVAETAWRVAMFGAVATTCAQLAWFTSPATLLVLGAAASDRNGSAASWLPPWSGAGGPSDALPILLRAVLACWATVAVFRLVGLVRAYRVLARETADRVPMRDEGIAARVRALCGNTVVRVSLSGRVLTPMVIGPRELCLPARALRELSVAELDAVLAHEIAHIARRDRLWLALAALVERVLFLQPLNVLAAQRLRAAAERSCDDWALRRIASPLPLASALARVTAWLAGAPAERFALGMASRESLALSRVRRILDPSAVRLADEHRPFHLLVGTTVLAAVVLLAPGVSAGITRYTIQAVDDAGPFTLTLERGRAVGMTIDGASVEQRLLRQSGNHVHVTDAGGEVTLDLTLTASGGIRWTSRPRQPVASR